MDLRQQKHDKIEICFRFMIRLSPIRHNVWINAKN